MAEQNLKPQGFDNLGINPRLMEILVKLRYQTPTPIQLKSIPTSIQGKDLVGIAQTGTGKTLAFGIPLIQRLGELGGKGLILLPTRELAAQVNESLQAIGKDLGLRTAVIIGGEPKNAQLRALNQKPHIIIATPGRLIDHLISGQLSLKDVSILVLDEADLMLDMGFAPQISDILRSVPSERQTMLFSATMPPTIMKMVTNYMKLPVTIEVAPAGTAAENVSQEMIVIKREDRLPQLGKILEKYEGPILIFSRTKHSVKKLAAKIKSNNYPVAEIHSDRTLGQRTQALKGFKDGRYSILVATDIAARGIDVKGIELVLNFDLPDNLEDYVHRIGRTARAGKSGMAITFVSPNEMKSIKKIEQIIKKNIPVTKLAEPEPDRDDRRPGRRNNNFKRRTPYRGDKKTDWRKMHREQKRYR